MAEPGYHKLHLDRYGITAELTATDRVGLHRYRYDKAGPGDVIVNLAGVLGEGVMKDAHVTRVGNDRLTGGSGLDRRTAGTPLTPGPAAGVDWATASAYHGPTATARWTRPSGAKPNHPARRRPRRSAAPTTAVPNSSASARQGTIPPVPRE